MRLQGAPPQSRATTPAPVSKIVLASPLIAVETISGKPLGNSASKSPPLAKNASIDDVGETLVIGNTSVLIDAGTPKIGID